MNIKRLYFLMILFTIAIVYAIGSIGCIDPEDGILTNSSSSSSAAVPGPTYTISQLPSITNVTTISITGTVEIKDPAIKLYYKVDSGVYTEFTSVGGNWNILSVDLGSPGSHQVWFKFEDLTTGGVSETSVSITVSSPEVLKIFTETTYLNSSPFNCAASWPVWSGGSFSISSIYIDTGEGNESMRCNLVTSSGGYWGMGVESGETSKNEDLSRFAGGYLKCKMRAPVGFSENVTIGVQSGTTHPSVQDHTVNPFSYGLVADGNWHDISVPITDLGVPTTGTYSLQTVHLAWMVTYAGNPTVNTYIDFDDVRLEAQ